MRAKFVTADGCFKWGTVASKRTEFVYFPIISDLKAYPITEYDPSISVKIQKRTYRYYTIKFAGKYPYIEYREVVD